MRFILIALFLLAFAGPALDTRGLPEINQIWAVETDCFSGDAAGSGSGVA